ncbi:MAG: haloacid dehalogenase-like hydrolase [Clostridia bacterium]|nr:haloacid dehalogenase-like hydrolase [Clostridia bacterium]
MSKIAAIMYDFDKTLSPKDMQDYAFSPEIGMPAEEFWRRCNDLMHENNMDSILAYMYYMVKMAKEKGIKLTRQMFRASGKNVRLFPGVTEWFSRMNEYGKSKGLTVEHYVISSGIREIIEGTEIAHEFRRIYAAEFYYDNNGEAVWPAMAVNYTSKTQFIYRINKEVLDVTDARRLNESTPEEQKRIPFTNMIYIGDGLTDVPCMKLVKTSGGHSVAVYQKEGGEADRLIIQGRAGHIAPTDFREGSRLDTTIKAILDVIAANSATTEAYIEDLQSAKLREYAEK